jgi:catechol 2,3-dioxygenase-like lactoylglutathione lyase family enzyme
LRRTERLRARAQRLVRHALLVLRDHDRRQGDRPGSSGPAQRVVHLPSLRGIDGNARAVMIRIRDIDHLVLRVTDVEAMIGFYCAVLGCTVERRRDDIGLVQLRAGRSLLDLVAVSGTLGAAGGAAPGVEGRNLDHFCLRLDTFDEAALRRELASAGITAGAVASRYGAEGEGPSLYVTDPEGNTVELKGPPWPDSPARESTAACGEPSPLVAIVSEFARVLTQARQSLDEEIRGYPTPIPRCDAQFNFLYEQRSRLARALKAIGDLDNGAATAASCRRVLAEFLSAPPFSDLPAEQALRARTAAALASDAR